MHRALQQGKLEVLIRDARNLTVDVSDLSGLADPICRVTLVNGSSIVEIESVKSGRGKSSSSSSSEKTLAERRHFIEEELSERSEKSTDVRYSTRSPDFRQKFTWRVKRFRHNTKILFEIFDVDEFSNIRNLESMGRCEIDLGVIVFAEHNGTNEEKFQLHSDHQLAPTRKKNSLPLRLKEKSGSESVGTLRVEWTYRPDGCPVAARGLDMLDQGDREGGFELGHLREYLGKGGLRAIGQFSKTPCKDDPKMIVPFLRDVYLDLSARLGEEDPEVDNKEFKSLLALVFHVMPSDIEHMVRGMDYDASGRVAQSEATSYFLMRSEEAALSGADEGAHHIASGISRSVTSSHGAGGVHTLHSLANSRDDGWSRSIIVGLQQGGARIYSDNLKRFVNVEMAARADEVLAADAAANAAPVLVHAAIDLPPFNCHSHHIPRKLYLACSDRKIKVYECPKRWDSLLVGSRYKSLRCLNESIQSSVPMCMEIMHRGDGGGGGSGDEEGGEASTMPYLWIGESSGDIVVRDTYNMENVVARWERAHDDGVTCIKRIEGHNLNTVVTAGMGGKINLIDPTRIGRKIDANHQSLRTAFHMSNGVLALDWSDNRHSLYTGDYSQHVKVWDPFVRKSTGSLGTHGSTGHRSNLLDIICNDAKNQLITTDVSGIVKVWDTRTLRCIQTTRDTEQDYLDHPGRLTSVCALDEMGNLLTGGRAIHRWNCLGAKIERETRASRPKHATRVKGRREEEVENGGGSGSSNISQGSGSSSGQVGKSVGRRRNKEEPMSNEEIQTMRENVRDQQAEKKLFCLVPEDENLVVTVDAEGHVTCCRFGQRASIADGTAVAEAKRRSSVVGIALDTTGDGLIDAVGYDTNHDGIVDALDINGDGRVNYPIGGLQDLVHRARGVGVSGLSLISPELMLEGVQDQVVSQFTIPLRHGQVVSSVDVDHSGRCCFVGTSDGLCRSFNLETGWQINEFQKRSREISCLVSMRLHSGFRLVGGGWDRKLTCWDADGKPAMSYEKGHVEGDITCLCQVESAFFASGDTHGRVCLWSTASRSPLKNVIVSTGLEGADGGGSAAAGLMDQQKKKRRRKTRSSTTKGPNLDELPDSIECILYDRSRRILFVGMSNGNVVALSSTTLGRVSTHNASSLSSRYGAGVLRMFQHSSVDALALNDEGGRGRGGLLLDRMLSVDAGRRLRLFELGRNDCRLLRCWQPRTKSDEISDVRHSVDGDRGSVSYSRVHRAFVTSSCGESEGSFCVQLWCSRTGMSTHTLWWRRGIELARGPSKERKKSDANFGEKDDDDNANVDEKDLMKQTTIIKIPKMLALSSIGEFALELDRMHLLRAKNPIVHGILNAREDESGGEEEVVEEEEEELGEATEHIGRASARLDAKLNAMFISGLVSFQGDESERVQRVKQRKERSGRKSEDGRRNIMM